MLIMNGNELIILRTSDAVYNALPKSYLLELSKCTKSNKADTLMYGKSPF